MKHREGGAKHGSHFDRPRNWSLAVGTKSGNSERKVEWTFLSDRGDVIDTKTKSTRLRRDDGTPQARAKRKAHDTREQRLLDAYY